MVPKGDWQAGAMPDTLDLAEHARLAVNALTNLRPDCCYACSQMFCFGVEPPSLGQPNWSCMLKYLRALPLMRTISGSAQNLDVEEQTMRAVLKQVSTDGLLYSPIGEDGPPKGTASPQEVALALQAMSAWHERDGNPEWLKWIQILSGGLKHVGINAGDYCYIPPECSLTPEGEWRWTLRGAGDAPGYLPYTPPAEPVHDSQGQEGEVKGEHAFVIEGLMSAFNLTGDAEVLEKALRMSRFCRKPAMWSHDTEDESTPPHEHGIYTGHNHGNLLSLRALLKLAVATDDMPLKQLVREGYEHARRHGVIRLGFMTGWVKPLMGRPKALCLEGSEACGSADTIMLGIMLSEAGLGDYWDDVDSMVRNHFIELQATDLELMRAAGAGRGYDNILKGFVGGFTQAPLTANLNAYLHGCCTGNGSRAIYYAWEGITRFDGRTATVNLLLNRVSPWLDVASYLPYEGLVELRNKRAECIAVRIPGWVDSSSVTTEVNGGAAAPLKSGNYLLFTALKPGDLIALRFSVEERTERYTIGETTYTTVLRGSTVVDIAPRLTDTPEHRSKYPFFVRAHLRANQVPVKETKEFIARN